jgi:3-hydroxyisobutyrate dehydrogenase
MKIGIAGTGRMGAAMAGRLAGLGHDMTVWNRSADKARALGLKLADSPAALAGASEALISMLGDAAAVETVYAQMLAGDVKGRLFIDMSTVRPEASRKIDALVKRKGGAFVECPVGGTVGPARTGKLLGLAGGSKEDVARAKPILEQLCRRFEHVGPVGAGASMKLAINLPLAVFWQSFGEAYTLCRNVGLDPDFLVELFSDTSGGTNVLKARGSIVAATLKTGRPATATFDCDSIRKDLRTMVAEAKGLGFELPIAERTLAVYDQASQEGWGHRDGCDLPAYWSSRKAR